MRVVRTSARHRPGSGIGVIERCFPETAIAHNARAFTAPAPPWKTTRRVLRARASRAWRSPLLARTAHLLIFPSDPTSSPDRRFARRSSAAPPEDLEVVRGASTRRDHEEVSNVPRGRVERDVEPTLVRSSQRRGELSRTEASDRSWRALAGLDGGAARRRSGSRPTTLEPPVYGHPVSAPHPSDPFEPRPVRPPRHRGALRACRRLPAPHPVGARRAHRFSARRVP